MAFVAGSSLVLGAGVAMPLPTALDLGGKQSRVHTLLAHARARWHNVYVR